MNVKKLFSKIFKNLFTKLPSYPNVPVEELVDIEVIKPKEKDMSFMYFNGSPKFKKFDWKYIVLHHSQSPDKDETAQMGDLRKWHMDENGWDYIGYHYVIEKVGDNYEIIQARPLIMNGAHEPTRNYDGIGICVIGNFDKEEMPAEAQERLAILVRTLQVQNDIDDDHVVLHRDFAKKSCPGTKFDRDAFINDYLHQVEVA